jgi:hypothetical protein
MLGLCDRLPPMPGPAEIGGQNRNDVSFSAKKNPATASRVFLYGVDRGRIELPTPGLEVSLSVRGPYGERYSQVFTHERPPRQYVDCTNPLCYYGCVDVGHILRTMVLDRQTTRESSVHCKGNEGAPTRKPCMASFGVKVDIDFRDAQESPSGHQPSE